MKLNLKQVLALSGMTRPGYNSRRNKGLLRFMSRADHDDGDRNRFAMEHAVALVAYNELLAVGVSTENAEYVIGNQFVKLSEALNNGLLEPGYHEIGPSVEPHHMFVWHVGLINFAGGNKLHIGGKLSWCLHKYSSEMARAVHVSQRTNDKAEIASVTPASIVMVNASEIYDRVRHNLLRGIGA